jgi:hypothetical protein
MFRRTKGFVSTVLPVAALTLLPGCAKTPNGSDVVQVAEQAHAARIGQNLPNNVHTNRAPVIDQPGDGYARAGQPFSYRPVVTDGDGDELRFTAANLPPWARVDAATGEVTGSPTAADAGIYEDIVITAADASHVTRSQPFSITVNGDVATGTATLRWEAPPSRLDGAPLDDLAGYRILFGRDSDNLDRSVLIDDPNVTTFEFKELPAGIWYFAVVAVNAGGLEGPPTTITMKSI